MWLRGEHLGRHWTLSGSCSSGPPFYSIPGVGLVIEFSPRAKRIVGVLEGADIPSGLSALGAAMYIFGFSQEEKQYVR